jgi:hypothetical protein
LSGWPSETDSEVKVKRVAALVILVAVLLIWGFTSNSKIAVQTLLGNKKPPPASARVADLHIGDLAVSETLGLLLIGALD